MSSSAKREGSSERQCQVLHNTFIVSCFLFHARGTSLQERAWLSVQSVVVCVLGVLCVCVNVRVRMCVRRLVL